MKKHLFLILALLAFVGRTPVYSQKTTLQIQQTSSTLLEEDYFKNQKLYFPDSIAMHNEIEKLTTKAQNAGYFNPFKKINKENDSIFTLIVDQPIKTDNIHLITKNKKALPKGFRGPVKNQITLKVNELDNFLQELNNFYQNKGDLFATIRLENIKYKNDKLTAELVTDNTKPRNLDKILIEGYEDFPKRFKQHYLKLSKKKAFNKKQIGTIEKKLNQLKFITQTKSPEVLFTNDSTLVYLYLKKNNSNIFDGLIGFSNKENSNGVRFNGHIHIELNNLFNKGERFRFQWNNNGNNLEQLNIALTSPFIFNSPISAELELNIRKQDSSFINTKTKATLNYTIDHLNTIGIFGTKENSNSSLTIENAGINTYTKTTYGLAYTFTSSKETRLKPKTQVLIQLDHGLKKTDIQNENQVHLFLKAIHNIGLTNRTSINIQTTFEELIGNNLLLNENYLLGGATTIRGFNEQSIQASAYNYTNIEYQIITANSSYLYTFSDIGFLKNKYANTNNSLYSLGLGYSYKTSSGHINMSYGFGKTNETDFNFQKGLFHIKLISFF
ncbi:BamA/TamA family outer membrane protein [Flavicella sediminum]|uniref:hypothetical protein n=1 Tax=Flavicella sediminum TaxID=2585141 RepID=UPI001121BEC9|nr:hypothetical protein [Flavicella sediminum]